MNSLFEGTVVKYNLLKNGDNVIVALSGGADSVSLLHSLIFIKEKYNLKIFAAHVNHNIRGKEAERDENFCKILCEKFNVELFVKSVDVVSLAKQQKISEELCGRNVRYQFFDELSQKLGAKVATAHTASDNAETMLYNIARGASLAGVGAIPPVRGNIIRPLIEVTRCQVEDYCKANSLDFVTDSTNLADDYTRNKIRHNVVPVLKELNPKLETAVSHLAENAREVTAYLNRQTQKALAECKLEYGYNCTKLAELDIAILKNAIALICKEAGADVPEFKHIELILNIIKNGGSVDLFGNFTAVAKQNVLRVVPKTDNCEQFIEIPLSDNLKFEYDCKEYSVKEIKDISNIEKYNCINADLIGTGAVFRQRKSDDKFTYAKRKITKPLRKVMNEMKIPSEIRNKILILAIDSTVLWCENIGVSMQGICNNNSKLALKVEINRKKGV